LEKALALESTPAPEIDMVAIEKYQLEEKAYWAAFGDRLKGIKTPMPPHAIPPPCFDAWHLREYGPPSEERLAAFVARWSKITGNTINA
jgi:hypothetical protein